jgi:hypothetical protein
MKTTWIIAALVVLMAISCRKHTDKVPAISEKVKNTSLGIAVADTIIYDVNIVSMNPDDPWEKEKLKDLHFNQLVDNIFDLIYTGKATAYNHDTGEKLTLRQVQDIEKEAGFSRKDIGMIQFREAWFMNMQTAEMNKKVISMVLGVPRYGDGGMLIGHKALFRVKLPDF